MAKMFKYSLDADVSKLDIFKTPPTNTSVQCERFIPIECNDNLNKDKIEWNIDQGGLLYYNLRKIRLQISCRIVDENGQKPVPGDDDNAGDEVYPVNHLLRSMWKEVEIVMGNKKVSISENNYHYKSAIKTLLRGVQTQSMKNSLMSEMFYEDSPGSHDPWVQGERVPYNMGAYERKELTGFGQEFLMEGSLGEDVFDTPNYLINGVKCKITLTRNNNKVILMSNRPDKNFKLEILKAVLKVPVVDVGPAIVTGHDAGFSEGGFGQYFFRQNQLQRFPVTKGNNKATFHIHSSSLLPNRIAMVFVSDKRYDGDYLLNPFKFEHLNIKNIYATLPDRTVPATTEVYDFSNRSFAPLLNNLYDLGPNTVINMLSFAKGYAIFVFNLNSLDNNKTQLALQRYGSLKIDVTFGNDLEETYQALVLSEFETCMQVDKIRQVEKSN